MSGFIPRGSPHRGRRRRPGVPRPYFRPVTRFVIRTREQFLNHVAFRSLTDIAPRFQTTDPNPVDTRGNIEIMSGGFNANTSSGLLGPTDHPGMPRESWMWGASWMRLNLQCCPWAILARYCTVSRYQTLTQGTLTVVPYADPVVATLLSNLMVRFDKTTLRLHCWQPHSHTTYARDIGAGNTLAPDITDHVPRGIRPVVRFWKTYQPLDPLNFQALGASSSTADDPDGAMLPELWQFFKAHGRRLNPYRASVSSLPLGRVPTNFSWEAGLTLNDMMHAGDGPLVRFPPVPSGIFETWINTPDAASGPPIVPGPEPAFPDYFAQGVCPGTVFLVAPCERTMMRRVTVLPPVPSSYDTVTRNPGVEPNIGTIDVIRTPYPLMVYVERLFHFSAYGQGPSEPISFVVNPLSRDGGAQTGTVRILPAGASANPFEVHVSPYRDVEGCM